MTSRVLVLLALPLLGAVCAGSDPNLTDDGQGRPNVEVDFPDQTSAASVETAVIDVANPGPGDIASLFVAFSLVGAGGGAKIPEPLVAAGVRGRSPSISDVRPTPDATSPDGVVYKFANASTSAPILKESESLRLQFDVKLPEEPGLVASSVQVYAGEDPERSRGALLETEVTGP